MMPNRRTILRLATFLLLGAAVNIAVAWECVLCSDLWNANYWPDASQRVVKSGEDQWLLCFTRRFGHIRISSDRFFQSGYEIDLRPPGDDDQLPTWSSLWSVSEAYASRQQVIESSQEEACGWPTYSLMCRYAFDLMARGSTITYGYPVPERLIDKFITKPRGRVPVLPLLPIWPGFAFNTIFYAAMLWLLVAAPFAVRRRRRIKRGLCPACAYPVGTSAVCTECGRTVMPHVPTLVRTKRVEP